jgi:transcriptional regulator GlxA family with amidase domain
MRTTLASRPVRPGRLFTLLAALAAGSLSAPAAGAPADVPLRGIGVLALPGVYNSELMAPYDVLQHLRFHVKPAPEIFTVAPEARPLLTFEGLTLTPRHGFGDAPPIDLLVVPSAEHNMDSDLEDRRLIGWVRDAGRKARLLLSLCDGAFVLAKAGLLDGLEATTFPADQDRFGAMFPQVKLQRGPLFVHDGKAVTSVGGARSYEAALYIVERLYGAEVARGIGRGLVIDWSLAGVSHRRAPGALWPPGAPAAASR